MFLFTSVSNNGNDNGGGADNGDVNHDNNNNDDDNGTKGFLCVCVQVSKHMNAKSKMIHKCLLI